MPRFDDFSPVHEDGFGVHDWSLELQECPITDMNADGSKRSHSHNMRCAACGIRRYGAYAEQGAYHYFTYDQREARFGDSARAEEVKRSVAEVPDGFFTHELLPPCIKTRELPSGIEVWEIEICADCFHYIGFYERSTECHNGCNAGAITLLGCFKRRK